MKQSTKYLIASAAFTFIAACLLSKGNVIGGFVFAVASLIGIVAFAKEANKKPRKSGYNRAYAHKNEINIF